MPKPKPVARVVRNPALVAAIRMDRLELGPVSVYADWLQANGDVAGELIVLEQQLGQRKNATKQKRAAALRAEVGMPPPSLATVGWRHGLWQWLRLDNAVDCADEKFDALGLAAPVFASPLCVGLEELRIGTLRWDGNVEDVPAVLAAAGKHAWAAELVRLHLGDCEPDIDMAHHVIGDVGKTITRHFPKLRELVMHSGEKSFLGKRETFGIGPLALPTLRSFTVETCALSKPRLAHVLAAKLPELTTLTLWFGSARYGANAGVGELRSLLAGKVLPTVIDLGLCNSEFSDAIAAALPTSAIAPRLTRLDLSMGTLSDEGARALVEGRAAFRGLETLSIDDNFVSAAVGREVAKAFRGVAVVNASQKADDRSVAGRVYRYVSVGE